MTIVARVTTWLRETTRHYRLLCLGLDGDVMNVNMCCMNVYCASAIDLAVLLCWPEDRNYSPGPCFTRMA